MRFFAALLRCTPARIFVHALAVLTALALAAAPSRGQDGAPQFTPLEKGPIDSVNRSNLNVNVQIPLVHTTGRGLGLNLALVNNSYMYVPSSGAWGPAMGLDNGGWALIDNATSHVGDMETQVGCAQMNQQTHQIEHYYTMRHQEFAYIDSNGLAHTFFVTPYYDEATPCNYSPVGPGAGAYERTASGLYWDPASSTMILPGGEKRTYFSAEDTNGNELSWDGGYTDSVGRQVTVSGTSPVTYTYTDSNGTAQTITETLESFNIETNFGCSEITEYTRTGVSLPVSVELPDGTEYTISYEATPGYPADITGRIAKITLPGGGYVSYSYGATNDGVSCTDGSTVSLTRTVNDGTNSRTWTYSRAPSGSYWALTETLPQLSYDTAANNVVDTFYGNELLEEDTYQGSVTGTPLQKVTMTWNPTYGTPMTRTTTLANNQQSEVATSYDSYGNLLETDEYDWGSGTPGSLLRKTVNTYADNSTYESLNIMNRLASTIVYDGGGTAIGKTQYEYDNYTAGIASSGATQHDANYGTSYTTRGNVTAVERWRSEDSTWMTTRLQYDDAGNVLSSTDPAGNTTHFSYADSWGNSSCAPGSGNGAAYVSSVTNALSQTSSAKYNSCTGTVASTTDANGETTRFSYDLFGRATEKDAPDGGETTISYTDAAPASASATTKINGSSNLATTTQYDGLGRATETEETSDPEGADYRDTVYDEQGRVYTVSNAYRATSDPSYGLTTYHYDALGRVVKVIDADGSVATTTYAGNCATGTDEAGKTRQTCTDGAGRLEQVTEDPGGAGYVTTYGYDALNDMTSVTENGSQTRTFTYDSLGRLTYENNPESGSVSYTWDADTNCGSPNAFAGELVSKVDARGIRTCVQYDALGRVTEKNYSDGTPGAIYSYDASNPFGRSATNTVGRLVGTWSSEYTWRAYSYDAMGRVTAQWDCFSSTLCPAATAAQYDYAGDLTQLTYPDGRVVTQAYDAGANLTQVQFASMGETEVGYNYLSSASYAANGAPLGWTLGNGVTETQSYNPQWQMASHAVANGDGTLLSRTYGYNAGTSDNGNVMGITDNVNSGRTLTFTYDGLNRVATAATAATSGADCWGQGYTYDAWGNLTDESVSQCTGTALSVTATTNNQLSATGVSYDASGDTTDDGTHSYTFDAAGELTQVDSGAAAYTYNAEGQRVQKAAGGATTQYVYFGGQPIAEYNAGTGGWSDYIYANGQRIARADTYEDRIHTYGNNCSDCGWQWAIFWFGSIANVDGYVVQSGDKLYLRQWQSSGAQGGIGVWYSDGSSTGETDQDGQGIDTDTITGEWQYRVIDLSSDAGKTISGVGLVTNGGTAAGAWDIYYNDIVLVGADGTVRPIYDRETSESFTIDGADGSTRNYEVNHDCCAGTYSEGVATTYYSGDALGSARMMTSENGYPVWAGEFLPFGQEWNAQTTANHYKFTGQERDAETGLDYFNARHYTSQYGRFMQPDPAGMAAVDPSNPQTWNRYAYVMNNPLGFTDPTGMCANGRPCPPPPPEIDTGESCTETYFSFNGSFGAGVNDDCEGYTTITYWAPNPLPGGGTPPAQPPQKPTPPPPKQTQGPTVPSNPCQYEGRALSPSDYATAGKSAPWHSLNFVLDVHYGWGSGQYLDAQPLTSVPGTWNAAAYGNYAYGVYMQAAGVSLSVALRGAEAYALTKTYPSGTPMQKYYPGLPAANAQNIVNGYKAQANGTTCH